MDINTVAGNVRDRMGMALERVDRDDLERFLPALAVGGIIAGIATGFLVSGLIRRRARRGLAEVEDDWVHVEESVRVARRPSDVYRFWHDLHNLEDSMSNVSAARDGRRRVKWSQKLPTGLLTAHWEAETVEDRKNRSIAWKTTADSQVPNCGRVDFEPIGRNATSVRFRADYRPPAGTIGSVFAPLVHRQIKRDLERLKHQLESEA